MVCLTFNYFGQAPGSVDLFAIVIVSFTVTVIIVIIIIIIIISSSSSSGSSSSSMICIISINICSVTHYLLQGAFGDFGQAPRDTRRP